MTQDYENSRQRLIRLLQAIPVMSSDGGRELVLDEMRRVRRFALDVSVTTNHLVDCVRIIDAAARLPGGLQQLVRAVGLTDRTYHFEAFENHVRERHPNEFLSVAERAELLSKLSEHIPADSLVTYYRVATGEPAQREFDGLDDLLREIEQRIWQGPGHPLVGLMEAIANTAQLTYVAEAAREWSDLLAERIGTHNNDGGAERASLERLRSSGPGQSMAEIGKPTLMLRLDPPTPRPDRYRFTAWLYLSKNFVAKIDDSEDGPLTLPDVRMRLSTVISKALIMAEQINADNSQMDLEFILPRHLLCTPIEQWTNLEPFYMSLGVQFVVVVRDLVRHKDPQRGPAWRRKWANVQQCTGNSADKLRHWITCATQPSEPGQVFHTLLGDDSVSLGLTFRPGDGSHVFDLAEALDAGMPIAIWPHRCEHSQAPAQPASPYTGPEFQGKLTERLASRGLAELPRIVFELRKEAGGHPGTGMTLLWDDPTRRPEPDYSLEAPALFQP